MSKLEYLMLKNCKMFQQFKSIMIEYIQTVKITMSLVVKYIVP